MIALSVAWCFIAVVRYGSLPAAFEDTREKGWGTQRAWNAVGYGVSAAFAGYLTGLIIRSELKHIVNIQQWWAHYMLLVLAGVILAGGGAAGVIAPRTALRLLGVSSPTKSLLLVLSVSWVVHLAVFGCGIALLLWIGQFGAQH